MLFVSAGFFFTIKKGTRQNKQNIFFGLNQEPRDLFFHVYMHISFPTL